MAVFVRWDRSLASNFSFRRAGVAFTGFYVVGPDAWLLRLHRESRCLVRLLALLDTPMPLFLSFLFFSFLFKWKETACF